MKDVAKLPLSFGAESIIIMHSPCSILANGGLKVGYFRTGRRKGMKKRHKRPSEDDTYDINIAACGSVRRG